jgi:LacI family transcriptional regulator
MSAATLADVAREAGVSLATASRVLNPGTRQVAEGYRDRVMETAKRLDYAANLAAQATARGLASTLTLLVPDITDPYFSTIASGVSRAAEEAGLITTMAFTHRDARREVQLVRALRGQRPRVLVIAGSRETSSRLADQLSHELDAYAEIGGRAVFLSQDTASGPAIDFTNLENAKELAETIVDLGYRRILVLAGPKNLVTVRERLRGLRAGARRAGAPIEAANVVHCELSRDGGYAAIANLSDDHLRRVDVAMAISDVVAIGAMTALRDRGFRIPEDVAVAGFDDIPTARDAVPPLTTVRLPLAEAGYAAVRAALDTAPLPPSLSGEIVLRPSTPRL